MKTKKIILVLLSILVIIGVFFAYKYAYKPHRDISTEQADYTVSAISLIDEFAIDPEAAGEKYSNKTITVTGKITGKEGNSITVNNRVFADLIDATSLKVTEGKITFKGRCIGYDELLEEIKFDQCSLQN